MTGSDDAGVQEPGRRHIRRALRCAAALLVVAVPAFLSSSAVPSSGYAFAAAPSIQLQPVATGLSSPLFVASPPGDSRLFILEQPGVIKVLDRGKSAPEVFLDISPKVLVADQQGLVGLAFHPQYAANGRFFVDYTRRSDQATVVAEYRVSAEDPNVADPVEHVLLVIPEPLPNLAGGTLAFGPDGYLYIGVGNAGVADDPTNTAQDLGRLLGKILRIDIDHPAPGGLPYTAPTSNPFAGPTSGRDEIFAYGLRNPWRFSFDRLTGQIYAGDVGNNAREEIDVITSGGNYGWRIREGLACSGYVPDACDAPGFIDPVVDYAHTGGRCAVIGGYAYRGPRGSLPGGTYVFADFCTGEIFVLDGSAMRPLLHTPFVISSFGEDAEGELYVIDWLGTVYRIIASGDTAQSPIAAAVLPASRSVAVGGVATAFATMIWTGPGTASDCEIAPLDPVPAGQFLYQTTDPATNRLTGQPNTPVDIASGGSQTFLVAFTPSAPFQASELRFGYRCANAPAAVTIPDLNTLLLSAGAAPTADIVAVSSTPSGDGIVDLPSAAGTGAFAVSTTNIGATASITVSADVGASELPIDTFVCATDAVTGACNAPAARSLTMDIPAATTATFTVIVSARDPIAFDPAYHRVYLRFKDAAGVTRGLTSVAVRSR